MYNTINIIYKYITLKAFAATPRKDIQRCSLSGVLYIYNVTGTEPFSRVQERVQLTLCSCSLPTPIFNGTVEVYSRVAVRTRTFLRQETTDRGSSHPTPRVVHGTLLPDNHASVGGVFSSGCYAQIKKLIKAK